MNKQDRRKIQDDAIPYWVMGINREEFEQLRAQDRPRSEAMPCRWCGREFYIVMARVQHEIACGMDFKVESKTDL